MINTFVILLTLLFIVMKFFGVVTWGWLVCFSPFIILLAIDLIMAVVVVTFGVTFYGKDELQSKLDEELKKIRKHKNN